MITEEKIHGIHRIAATSTSPDNDKEQDAYRSETKGIYHMIFIIEKICEKCNTRSGGITAACGGTNSIKKSMDANTIYSCQSNHFNLISAIYKKLTK